MRYFDPAKMFALASVLFVIAGAIVSPNVSGCERLSSVSLSEVRGSQPQPPPNCTSNYSYCPCSEKPCDSASCWRNKTEPTCNGSCRGCNSVLSDDICTGAAPWNNMCTSAPQDNTGC